MKILIYGAGVIGQLYAALFHKAGENVTVYARGRRLESLRDEGIRYDTGKGIRTAAVQVIGSLQNEDAYDFIFLTVREEQLIPALKELRENKSRYIVTMVNTAEEYSVFEKICGKGRIIPAFPGAGGGFEEGVLYASLTPSFVQPTTFGPLYPTHDAAVRSLKTLFHRAKIPYSVVPDMHIWQICHLALVVPIGDAYQAAKDPAKAGLDRVLMDKTARALQNNFKGLVKEGITISPAKLNILRFLPVPLMRVILRSVFCSKFGDRFMYRHAVKAPGEMRALHDAFYGLYPQFEIVN